MLVEQVAFLGATVGLSDEDELPFPYEYAADRSQAWIMLSFGESVIGLQRRLGGFPVQASCPDLVLEADRAPTVINWQGPDRAPTEP